MDRLLKLFGREPRESLRVADIKASRAVYMGEDTQDEIEITIEVDIGGGDMGLLTLRMHPKYTHKLIGNLGAAYQAVCPPLSGPGTRQAEWQGASEQIDD